MGIALLLLGSVLCFFIPKGGFKYTEEKTETLELTAEKLGVAVTQEELDRIQKELENEMIVEVESGVVDVTIGGEDFVLTELEKTDTGLRIVGTTDVYDMDFRELAWGLLVLAVLLGITQVTLYFIGFLCKAFRDCESPFEENVIKKMQHLAYALIPWTVASSLVEIVINNIIRGNKGVALSVDFGVILVVLLVFLLAYIFKYGAILQQESDETL